MSIEPPGRVLNALCYWAGSVEGGPERPAWAERLVGAVEMAEAMQGELAPARAVQLVRNLVPQAERKVALLQAVDLADYGQRGTIAATLRWLLKELGAQ